MKNTNFLIHKVGFAVNDLSEMPSIDSSEDLRRDANSVVLVLFEHIDEEDLAILSDKHIIDFGLDL
jgi:hypothetical protein